ncbi:lipoprotein (plasmid) [Streptomyces sp. BI20]|uniref:lipoprotein n=1 Tax=Streptomyces sp. BI20 TaxID=3403460 RepID=UPI003C725103
MRGTEPTRRPLRVGALALAGVALAGTVLTGCGDAAEEPKKNAGGSTAPSASPSSANTPGAAGAPAGVTVGGKGGACPLPVSFSAAKDWSPKAVSLESKPGADADIAAALKELATRGPLTLRCEVDAKPAGNIGFLRVWAADKPGTARAALDAFLAGEKVKGTPKITEAAAKPGVTPAGSLAVFETESLDETKPVRAFAGTAADGTPYLLELGGMDADEHKAMLPALDLALATLKPAAS